MGRLERLLLGGWGRRAAWVVLILFLAIQAGLPSVFNGPRIALFDTYQRALPRTQLHKGVVIVAIDNASLAQIGQWPWPHQITAALVSRIVEGKPGALGIDMIWAERARESPEQWLKDAGALPPIVPPALKQLPRHDALLRKALKSGPVAIGIGGISDSPMKDD